MHTQTIALRSIARKPIPSQYSAPGAVTRYVDGYELGYMHAKLGAVVAHIGEDGSAFGSGYIAGVLAGMRGE
jgi:hypothetical protein